METTNYLSEGYNRLSCMKAVYLLQPSPSLVGCMRNISANNNWACLFQFSGLLLTRIEKKRMHWYRFSHS